MDSVKVTQLNESLYEFHRPQDALVSMQVVFFHGFQRGDYEDAHRSTWLSEDKSCIWPQTWLVEMFPDAQILTVSYNAGLTNIQKSGDVDMFIVVENVISDLLSANIGQEPRCPVILVGHSFGGLVIKQLCVRAFSQTGESKRESRDSLMLENLLGNLKGLFFYATPHSGIPVVDPELLMAGSPLLEYVITLSKSMARLNFDFDNLEILDRLQIAGLGESLPSKWGTFDGLVVPEASSRRGPNFNIVRADHISISRPPRRTSRRFYAFTELLQNIAIESEKNELPENFQHFPGSTGIQLVLEEVKSKLSKTARLGFVGMGGIGKTTLAMALFNDLERHYEYTCFIRNVKDIEATVKKVEDAVLENMHYRGKQTVEKGRGLRFKLRGKRLLLVLDDVSSERDLDIVRILTNGFGVHKDSRFLATSRNKELLASDVDEVYPVPFLSPESSKDLFLKCAPNGLNPPFQMYVAHIVEKCEGLPLTLEVVGKYLYTKSDESIWKLIVQALDKAENVAGFYEKLWAKLRVSYDGLPKEEKDMFLDASTVFYKSELSTAKAAWSSSMEGFQDFRWQHLLDLSLVWEIRDGERSEIGMHEQLLNLGRKIASTPRENGRRIWNNSETAFKLLSADKYSVDDMKDIIALKSCKKELASQNTGSSGGLESASGNHVTVRGSTLCEMDKLQCLWLEGLDIDDSTSESQFWRFLLGRRSRILLPSTIVYLHLSSMNFSDFPFNPGDHSGMAILSLRNIDGYRTLPATFGQLTSLQMLTIEGNNHLESLDDSLGSLKKLKHLIIERCPKLRRIPESLGQLRALETLGIGFCDSLLELPESIDGLLMLKDITITGCVRLQGLPDRFILLPGVERMELTKTSLQRVPNVQEVESLKILRLSWGKTAQFPNSLPKCLEEGVTKSTYTFPVTFNVVNGIFYADRPDNFQHLPSVIVGMEQVLVEVKRQLESRTSLGLAGMGGIGKTTLAMALFNDLASVYEYTCLIIGVKDIEGSVKDAVLRNMYHRGKKIAEQGHRKNLGFLTGKRLLLVLDDVASEEDLEIMPTLLDGTLVHKESRFIATSRDSTLCRKLLVQVYHVPFLGPDSSKRLLLALAFPEGVPDFFDRYVDDIVAKCDGLPLTLEAVGTYLHAQSQKPNVLPEDMRKEVAWALDNPRPSCNLHERFWARLMHSYDGLHLGEQATFLGLRLSAKLTHVSPDEFWAELRQLYDGLESVEQKPFVDEKLWAKLRHIYRDKFWAEMRQLYDDLDRAEEKLFLDERLWAELRHSYDRLETVEQQFFLDAANAFYMLDLETAKDLWRFTSTTRGLQDMVWKRLVDLSLVWEIREFGITKIGMQTQLRSLGRRIAVEIGDYRQSIFLFMISSFIPLESYLEALRSLRSCSPRSGERATLIRAHVKVLDDRRRASDEYHPLRSFVHFTERARAVRVYLQALQSTEAFEESLDDLRASRLLFPPERAGAIEAYLQVLDATEMFREVIDDIIAGPPEARERACCVIPAYLQALDDLSASPLGFPERVGAFRYTTVHIGARTFTDNISNGRLRGLQERAGVFTYTTLHIGASRYNHYIRASPDGSLGGRKV